MAPVIFRGFCERRWCFQQWRDPTRRTPVTIVGPLGVTVAGVVAFAKLAWTSRVARGQWQIERVASAAQFVREEAVFDEPYNIIRLHRRTGPLARARVPALRCIVTPRGAGEPNRWADERDWRFE